MNAPFVPPLPSCASIDDHPFGLTRILDPDIQIAQWQRRIDSLITQWLEQHHSQLGGGLRQTLAAGQTVDLSALPAGAGRDALAADLTLLADMLVELLDARHIGLRLEVVHQAMCPRLHVDRVGVRMVCTYRGPGTEWVEEAQLDRRFLGSGAAGQSDAVSGLLLPGHHIDQIPPFSVALLKGSLWQGNAGRGLVHRSPAVFHPPCVLVALDASW